MPNRLGKVGNSLELLKTPFTRREFIGILGTGLLTACAGSSLLRGSARSRVIIVGAGLAGLCAAYELERAGFAVTVLEQTSRAGGRVFTRHNATPDGKSLELGAVRFGDVHHHVIQYANRFGLTMDEVSASPISPVYHLKGRSYREGKITGVSRIPANWKLTESEQKIGIGNLVRHYTQALLKFGAAAGVRTPEDFLRLDDWNQKSFFADFTRSGCSPFAAEIVRAYHGTDMDHYASGAWLAAEMLDADWNRTYQIRGGNDLLPKAFRQRLKSPVRLDAKVIEITDHGPHAEVIFESAGQRETLSADFVICAVSPAVLRRIRLRANLRPELLTQIDRIEMSDIHRNHFVTRTRFWTERQHAGLDLAYSDLAVERLWDMTAIQPGGNGIILAYSHTSGSQRLRQTPASRRATRALNEAEQILPGIRANLISQDTWIWRDQDWVGGAWANYGPRQAHWILNWQVPAGRIQFAGDHTEIRCGWQDGALASGIRVSSHLIRQA